MSSGLGWYVNRLKAMSLREILWRFFQILIQEREKKSYATNLYKITSNLFNSKLSDLSFNSDALGLNMMNKDFSLNTEINLLSGFEYRQYKTYWNAGFQTDSVWPDTFSYNLNYKQRDDIGDARTNWELNRHFQFSLLAKDYFASGNQEFLDELQNLFCDWNNNNAFLHGISWTSIMEVAIRSISWMTALTFLYKRTGNQELLTQLEIGILNMVDYVSKHYSRGSSANNHLIVEAVSIGLGGFCFGKKEWTDLAFSILDEQIDIQNYPDGVNKEMSLHYQLFEMEAYLLFMHAAKNSGMDVPEHWIENLKRQSEFVAYSCKDGVVCEFGDDDEGKILDLAGGKWSHWHYLLQFASLELAQKYTSFDIVEENISWLFSRESIEEIDSMPIFSVSPSRIFAEGGYSFFHDLDGRVRLMVDHAPLGFGSICAHGHADVLSFQMIVDGNPIFVDPGTYIYHCDIESRNSFRKTINHNTLCVNGEDQSEMLGAFLWGKRAECKVLDFNFSNDRDILVASHNGYAPIEHQRRFDFDRNSGSLIIIDSIDGSCSWVSSFCLGIDCKAEIHDNVCHIEAGNTQVNVKFEPEIDELKLESGLLSTEYGKKENCVILRAYGTSNLVKCIIDIDNG